MKRLINFVVIASALLCACDGSMRIRGEAPEDASCVLTLTDQTTGRVANSFTVSGQFSHGIFFPGTWRAPPVTLDAICSGKLVRTVPNPSLGEINLGQIGP